MLSVTEATERILKVFKPVGTEHVPFEEAVGRVLAEELIAHVDLPAFDNSSLDGFAVRSKDLLGASSDHPVSLPVSIDIPAGSPPGITLSEKTAARIMTGAAMPDGADAVVMLEDTDYGPGVSGASAPDLVKLYRTVASHENVRRRGADMRAGQVVFDPGRRLSPADVGLLAVLGSNELNVYRRPRIAILSSGDELLLPGAPPSPGKIRDSNSPMLAALVTDSGADPLRLGIARDRPAAVQELLDLAIAAQADLIISSAGVSVGAFDFVREVVQAHGTLEFWRVNMRPGKPLAFGNYHSIPLLGLPGNPVSAYVGYLVFAAPAIQRLCGVTDLPRMKVQVRTFQPISSDGRESYLRAIVRTENGGLVAELAGHQGSGDLFGLTRANALLIIPSGVKSVPPGAEVTAWLL